MATNGPHPLFTSYAGWLPTRAPGETATDAERAAIEAARVARAQNRLGDTDRPALLRGCIFEVLSTTPDQQEPAYLWAYGKVIRCAEPVADGVLEPQMGVRPNKLRTYDGLLGYFPMSLLEPYTGTIDIDER
jgi:hypothetical protein